MHKKVLSVLASLFIATAPLGISSVYAVGEKIDNAFAFNYNVKDNSISSVLKIDGSVCIGGFEAVLNYDAEKYSVESTAKENADILMNVIPSKGEIVISMASNSNLVNTADLIRVEFVCSETPVASDFSFEITDAYMIDENNDLENVEYTIKENWYGLNEIETTTTTATTIKATTASVATSTTKSTTTTTSASSTTALSTTSTHTAETTTTTKDTTKSPVSDKTSEKNNFVISVKENKETNNVEISLSVGGKVEFLTAEGSIKINASGLGEPVLLSSISDSMCSYKTEDNNIYFTVISSTGENITEEQTIFTYAFPIEKAGYNISCSGKIADICDQNYNDADYAIAEKNETASSQMISTSTTATETTASTSSTTSSATSYVTTNPAESTTASSSTTMTETSYSNINDTIESTTIISSTTETAATSETSDTATENHINASPYELSNWAENDYYKKTGIAPYRSEYVENEDGTLKIKLFDEQENLLDIYTIHSKTGKGFNRNGDEVNLPQTGNNSLLFAAITTGSFVMIIVGGYFAKLSGITRKKKNEQ